MDTYKSWLVDVLPRNLLHIIYLHTYDDSVFCNLRRVKTLD